MKLTKSQKNQIYNKTMIIDDYEWVPCINHVLKVLGCEDMLEHDENYETVKWSVTEPLIKDEKIRKAVRAWAEVNSIEKALYAERPNRSLCGLADMGENDYSIDFVGWIPTLEDDEEYTITELCGEEEE